MQQSLSAQPHPCMNAQNVKKVDMKILSAQQSLCMHAQIVKKVDMESARGRKKRNPLNDLRREVAIMRTLRHKNIVALQVHFPAISILSEHASHSESGPSAVQLLT